MDTPPQMRRTRVVDLGRMPREELIEIAKKQASSIREKSTRINFLEELVEQLTGSRPTDAAAAVPRGSSLSSLPSTEPLPPEQRSELALQQATEEEQLNFAMQMSRNEETIRELQAKLDGKTLELAALQEKIKNWQEKVILATQIDQQTISDLRKQLEQVGAVTPAPSSSEAATATIPHDILEAAVQVKLATWKERVKAKMQEQMDYIQQLEYEINSLRSTQGAPTSSGETQMTDITVKPQPVIESALSHGSVPIPHQDTTYRKEEHMVQQEERPVETVQQVLLANTNLTQQQQEIEKRRSPCGETDISLEPPTQVVDTISNAAVTEVKQLQRLIADREIQSDNKVASLTLEVQRLRAGLEEARRETEKAVAAAESAEHEMTHERDETVASLTLEVQRLRAELEEARRERVVVSGDKNCLLCVSKSARMQQWKNRVKLIIAKGDEERRVLEYRLTSLEKEKERSEIEFLECTENFRTSMELLQAELKRIVAERQVMQENLIQLHRFKSMVMQKIGNN